MAYNKKYLSFDEQLDLFEERGMEITNRENALERIKSINYYKIKEFSKPFYEIINNEILYKEGTTFRTVIKRFYEDKNLRMYFLRAVEKIELSFKANFAYILGKKYGAFGYLEFNKWCNKTKYCRYYIADKEKEFKKRLKVNMAKRKNKIIEDFENENGNSDYPPIWFVVEVLTFGEILDLFDYMSFNNQNEIAKVYDANSFELYTWLRNLHLVRNSAAHNSNIVDMKFKRIPSMREDWKKLILPYKTGYTNRIALSIIILYYLVKIVNKAYKFNNIKKCLKNLASNDDEAEILGFSSYSNMLSIFE